LLDNLDSGEAKGGQSFSAALAESVNLGDTKVLARGTRINGEVTEVVSSRRLKQPASIKLTLTSIGKLPVQTEVLQIDGKSHTMRNAALIGGSQRAAIGRAVGTGAGTGTAHANGKQEIVLPSETELTFVLSDGTRTSTRTPGPVIEPNIERAPESKPVKWRDDSRDKNDDAYDALIFSERDKWVIRSYFKSNYGNLPLGLAKRGGDLPPGLEKHLRPDETLTPSLQQLEEPLPAELTRQLPMLPFGYSRTCISGRVLILADDGQIVDLMFIYH
jgi:hypothetical protein